MKFIKGMLIGGAIAMGGAMLYKETMGKNKKKMMKIGKQMIKKMGII